MTFERLRALRAAYEACYDYDSQRRTVGSLILFWSVQVLWHDAGK